nr:MAG TPA: hypothetical protein [Caudoviricetes sp.]
MCYHYFEDGLKPQVKPLGSKQNRRSALFEHSLTSFLTA